ncbi:MAG: hypothetical protein AB7T49_20445 [Oligoflexales bacterium]
MFRFLAVLLATTALGKPAPGKVNIVTVEVNGEPSEIRNNEKIGVVKGDTIKIRSVSLYNAPESSLTEVNFIGFPGRNANPNDDRNLVIRSDKDLTKKWSVKGDGETFAIKIGDKSGQIGEVFIQIAQPVLKYAVIKVNGKEKIVHDNEPIKVAGADMVKVDRVETNLPILAKDLRFQIVPRTTGKDRKQYGYEIRFLRNDNIFASVPLGILEEEKIEK